MKLHVAMVEDLTCLGACMRHYNANNDAQSAELLSRLGAQVSVSDDAELALVKVPALLRREWQIRGMSPTEPSIILNNIKLSSQRLIAQQERTDPAELMASCNAMLNTGRRTGRPFLSLEERFPAETVLVRRAAP